ncbi:CoA transferase, partial [Roseomonas alkaliterrae]|nr:CoA transferase [Neoroseomonas alkaliterrae]
MPVPPPDAFAALWRLAGLPPGAMPETVLDGADPVQPSTYALGTAALASIGACGAA